MLFSIDKTALLSTPNAAKNIETIRKMNQPFQTERVESLIIIFSVMLAQISAVSGEISGTIGI